MNPKNKRLEISRRIEAPAELIFEILANPNRHMDFDGSGMLCGTNHEGSITKVGESFMMKMHRLGDDYLILNHVVEFEPSRRIFWEPAPGDISRAEGNDPSKIGIPAGYRWGYVLTSEDDDATVVTEIFDCSALSDDLLRDGGAWINGNNSLIESMTASLAKLEKISIQ
ncbi:MAG: hypothetical protein Q7R42_02140 [Candidatus Planktophila sp.]|nr:hypothetical protein [Candidatus Planktophila sp.]